MTHLDLIPMAKLAAVEVAVEVDIILTSKALIMISSKEEWEVWEVVFKDLVVKVAVKVLHLEISLLTEQKSYLKRFLVKTLEEVDLVVVNNKTNKDNNKVINKEEINLVKWE